MVETIEALVDGGQASAGPPLGPALGPLGINIKQVIDKINEETKVFEGMKVPVKVQVDAANKTFTIEVGTPPTSSLIMKELNIEKGSSANRTEKVGNLTMDQVKKIVKMKSKSILGRTVTQSVKEVLGTCVSMGVTVEAKDPRDIQQLIDQGNYKITD
ncbi:50S ribosomal protein L11 [[Eubacterium] cellulosolvens]